MARAIKLHPKDNVVVCIEPVKKGDIVSYAGGSTKASEDIPIGHKMAIEHIEMGETVVKYGEIIGIASSEIEVGRHVHIHNVTSLRFRRRCR